MTWSVRRPLAVAVASILAAAVVVLAGPARTAQASTTQCLNGANGFANTPSVVPGAQTALQPVYYSGVKVDLRYGVFAGGQRGWARISNARSTDQVMFEWSTNGGYPVRIQCGWFSAGSDGFAVTPGLRTSSNPSYVFRACGRRPSTGAVWCTGWW